LHTRKLARILHDTSIVGNLGNLNISCIARIDSLSSIAGLPRLDGIARIARLDGIPRLDCIVGFPRFTRNTYKPRSHISPKFLKAANFLPPEFYGLLYSRIHLAGD
jgi:hypothetical protein